MPRRRTYDYNRFSGGSGAAGLNQAIQNFGKALQERREAPALEEDRQQLVRERAVKNALAMLSLGMDKNQIVRELGKVGFAFPEREITERTLAHPLGVGEDPEAAAFIPRVETTRREVDTSGLQTPDERFTSQLRQTEESGARGRQQSFELGQQGAAAGVTRESERRAQFPTTDELWAEMLKKIKDGVPLTPEDNRFVTGAGRSTATTSAIACGTPRSSGRASKPASPTRRGTRSRRWP